MVGWVAFKVSLCFVLKFKPFKMWQPMSLFILLWFLLCVGKVIPYKKGRWMCSAAQLKSTFGDSCFIINFMNSIRFGTCKLQVFYSCHSRSALFSINISIYAEFWFITHIEWNNSEVVKYKLSELILFHLRSWCGSGSDSLQQPQDVQNQEGWSIGKERAKDVHDDQKCLVCFL